MVPCDMKYWRIIAPVAKRSIARRWGRDVAKAACMRGKLFYRDLLLCAPDLGKGNPMIPTFCESMVFVALWLGAGGAISTADLRLVTEDVLGFAPLKVVGIVRNASRGPHALDFQLRGMRNAEEWAKANEGSFESAWRVSFDEKLHQGGIFFEFTRCPIAEPCANLGISDVTPALCYIDYLMVKLIHARLFRDHTIADGGTTCDYWIVGDEVSNPK